MIDELIWQGFEGIHATNRKSTSKSLKSMGVVIVFIKDSSNVDHFDVNFFSVF